MTTIPLGTLSLQLVCQLVVPGNSSFNSTNFETVDQSLREVEPTVLLNSTSVLLLATLSLQHVCHLLVTSNLSIAENVTLVKSESSTETQLETSAEDYESSSLAPAVALDEGYVTFRDVRSAYKVYEDIGTTWNEARDRCAAEGAMLAIPDSIRKIKHINSLRTKQNTNKWLHTGIQKSNVTNKWIRIDNDRPASPILWYKGFPDDIGDCTGIAIGDDRIVNYGCDWNGYYYVCEKPLTRPHRKAKN